jgi:hypothetical protein
MTAHSPAGLEPEKFKVKKTTETIGSFANNDIYFEDETGINHDDFSYGLKKSLLNYMHGIGFEFPLQNWFDFKVPKTKISPQYISTILNEEEPSYFKPNTKVIWIGNQPVPEFYNKTKKGITYEMAALTFQTKMDMHTIQLNKQHGIWLTEILQQISIQKNKIYTLQEIKTSYENHGLSDFEIFWFNKPVNTLQNAGLLSF